MSELQFYLAHYYDRNKKQFIPFLYTNLAQNVMLDADSDETVADALAQLEKQINTGISRPATIVIAAADASDNFKKGADYVCDGYMDEVEINKAIEILGNKGGKILLSEGHFWIGNGDVSDYNNVYGGILIRGNERDYMGDFSGAPRNITIEGMGVATAVVMHPQYDDQTYCGIRIDNSTHNTIKNLRIVNGNEGGNSVIGNKYSIYMTGFAVGNVIDNIYFTDTLNVYKFSFILPQTYEPTFTDNVYNPHYDYAPQIYGSTYGGGCLSNKGKYYGIYMGYDTAVTRISKCTFNTCDQQNNELWGVNNYFIDNILKQGTVTKIYANQSAIRVASAGSSTSWNVGNNYAVLELRGNTNTCFLDGDTSVFDFVNAGANKIIKGV